MMKIKVSFFLINNFQKLDACYFRTKIFNDEVI